ncbi:MAG: UDP-N-acetylglucosamine--N-acetylmuramyl-(pentapeptide) pyrophosphoryl-undecaprenol N-acetylglucosamine transferase, partial [Cellvibrionales bacterium]|nr:UDP-N-acetylglucosamine--N-acetylmuramyl-(pentapeptide) pyrophosphoryl-undecaprenol N-acetylglucosamine transferase [Cellvibrionales bacterium]
VPSPNVAEDHQTKNAMALIDKNAALMLRDGEAVEHLEGLILDVLDNQSTQKSLGENIKKLAMPNASKLIVDEVLKLIQEK